MAYNSSINYESFYGGGISSFDPEYGNFTGYKLSGAELGQAMNPMTANQVDETVKTLKTGVKQIEVQMLGPATNDVDQVIPKQHFKEIKALMKLSGATASVHGPIIDPAGFTQQAADETERLNAERRFVDTMQKAHELSTKGQNIPVVLHASNGMPGGIWTVDETKKVGEEGRMVLEKDFAINRDTGQVVPLKREKKYYPEHPELLEKGYIQEPDKQLGSINVTEWDNKMTELAQFNKHADEIIGSSKLYLGEYWNAVTRDGTTFIDTKTNTELPGMTKEQVLHYNKVRDADIFLENVQQNFRAVFNKAYEYGTSDQKKELKGLADIYSKGMNSITPSPERPYFQVLEPMKKKDILRSAINGLNEITKKGGAPQIYISTHDYSLDKSSDTFANTAITSYKEFGSTMPVIAIENYVPGQAFNRGKDLKELVKVTREKFAERLHEEKKMGMSRARDIAEKQIGATWDVGHVNIHKKYGLTDEDIIKETEAVADVVKHLHLTDNFGYSDSHLVPGMGNVPFKKHLEKLEKAGILSKVRKVIEAGGYVKDISQKGVHGESLAAFGSAIYGAKMAPTWNQTAGLTGAYFGGYGMINPPTHHSIYGAGFTSLPIELGGVIPGGGSRFSGNSMA